MYYIKNINNQLTNMSPLLETEVKLINQVNTNQMLFYTTQNNIKRNTDGGTRPKTNLTSTRSNKCLWYKRLSG